MPRYLTFIGIAFTYIIVLSWSCSPLKKYANESKKWEDDISKFEQLDQNTNYADNSILFVGSSSIRLWTTIGEDLAPYEVIQRGYGGAKLSDVAYYAERIIYPHNFDALMFFVGNDIWGNPDDHSPKEMAGLFKYILKTVRNKYPDKPVFYIEIRPVLARWNLQPLIAEADQKIKAICDKDPNTYFIPTVTYFLDENGEPIKSLFAEDNVHLNKEGYEIWTRLIKEALDENLSK